MGKSKSSASSKSQEKKSEDGRDSDSVKSNTSSLMSIPYGKGKDGDLEVTRKVESTTDDGAVAGPSKPKRSVAVKRTNPKPNEVVPAKRRAPPRPSPSPSPDRSVGKSLKSLSPSPPPSQTNKALFESLLAKKHNDDDSDIDEGKTGDVESREASFDLKGNIDSENDQDGDDDDSMFVPVTIADEIPVQVKSSSAAVKTPKKATEKKTPKKRTPAKRVGKQGKKRNATKSSSTTNKSSSVASLTPTKSATGRSQRVGSKQDFLDMLSSTSSSRSPSPVKVTSNVSYYSDDDLFEPIPIVPQTSKKSGISSSALKEILKKNTAKVCIERLDPSVIRRATRHRDNTDGSERQSERESSNRTAQVNSSFSFSDRDGNVDSVVVEVCVDNVKSLENAAKGGANR